MISDYTGEAWDKILISVTFAALKRWLVENYAMLNKEPVIQPIILSTVQLINLSTYQPINLSTYKNV